MLSLPPSSFIFPVMELPSYGSCLSLMDDGLGYGRIEIRQLKNLILDP